MLEKANNEFTIPKVQSSALVFDEFIKIRRDTLENEEGFRFSYYTLQLIGPAALVLARTVDNKFVLIKEYRHPTQKTLLSLPGGYVDPGESPVEAAKRELEEEAGYTAENFQVLGSSYPYPGLSSQPIFYITAENAVPTASPNREPMEFIETSPQTYEEFSALVSSGHPIDGNLLTAFWWLNFHRQ